MPREEYINSDVDIRVFHCGKMFRYSNKESMVGKGEKHGEIEESDPCVVHHITPYEERKRK
jgi:hypothetical protein